MVARLQVVLDDGEERELLAMADEEMRDPRDQLRYLLASAIRQRQCQSRVEQRGEEERKNG